MHASNTMVVIRARLESDQSGKRCGSNTQCQGQATVLSPRIYLDQRVSSFGGRWRFFLRQSVILAGLHDVEKMSIDLYFKEEINYM